MSWSTLSEIEFIRRIGLHADDESPRTVAKVRVLLRGYLEGARIRSRWGNINAVEAVKFAEAELQALDGLQDDVVVNA